MRGGGEPFATFAAIYKCFVYLSCPLVCISGFREYTFYLGGEGRDVRVVGGGLRVIKTLLGVSLYLLLPTKISNEHRMFTLSASEKNSYIGPSGNDSGLFMAKSKYPHTSCLAICSSPGRLRG